MKKVLIADDDPAICDALEMCLMDLGYKVESTVDGQTISRMKNGKPDLLLLDIWMSGQDGRDIAKLLKSQADTKDIPIIMISASRDLEKDYRSSGADDFLAKPFNIDELARKVERLIGKSKST